jgi:hypothetical protein
MSRTHALGRSINFPHHHPSNGHAAGVAVSHLFHGAARHSHRVQLAWQVVMGFFLLHGGSVCRHGLGRKPEIFQIQGGCQ